MESFLAVIGIILTYYLLIYLLIVPGFTLFYAIKLIHTASSTGRYLASLLLTVNIYCILMAISLDPAHVLWKDYIVALIALLIAPLEFLFISGFIPGTKARQKKEVLHAIPFALISVTLASAAIINGSSPTMYIFDRQSGLLFAMNCLVLVQHIMYAALTTGLIFSTRVKSALQSGSIDKDRIRICRKMAILHSLSIFFGAITVAISHEMYFLLVIALTLYVLTVVAGIIRKPAMFLTNAGTAQKQKYRKTRLDEGVIEQYFLEIESALCEEELFRDTAISLNALAKHLNLPVHHVSQVINHRLKMSFSSYVNQLRVDFAKRILLNPDSSASIIDICYESGFSSKTTFNTVFKKLTGRTPSDLRN